MEKKENKFISFIKRPKGFLLGLIYFLTFMFCVGSIISLIIKTDNVIVEICFYVLYGISALLLAFTVYSIVIYAKNIKASFIKIIRKNKILSQMLDNYGYRTVMLTWVNTTINLMYLIFNLLVAIIYRSGWYASLSGYYVLLTLMRGTIILYYRKKGSNRWREKILKKQEYKHNYAKSLELVKYKVTGIMLLVLPIMLSFAILLIVKENRAFIHVGWVIYAVAAHAFYKITMAIINMFRVKRAEDSTLKALRCIGLADAFVSILALQTTLLYAFSDGAKFGYFNAITGALVCALTFTIGVHMLIDYKRRKNKNIEE